MTGRHRAVGLVLHDRLSSQPDTADAVRLFGYFFTCLCACRETLLATNGEDGLDEVTKAFCGRVLAVTTLML